MRLSRRFFVTICIAAVSVIVAACSSNSADAGHPMSGMTHTATTTAAGRSSDAATHNDADVVFAQNMIVHHQAAIDMAKFAADHASSRQVQDLAARIEVAQAPEITEMTGWLTGWGQPVTAESSMPGMDMDNATSVPGMMTSAQMNKLKTSTGQSFDRQFLTLMTAHHQGAITMARTEQADGADPQAIALAKSIATAQTSEVTQMGKILQQL